MSQNKYNIVLETIYPEGYPEKRMTITWNQEKQSLGKGLTKEETLQELFGAIREHINILEKSKSKT